MKINLKKINWWVVIILFLAAFGIFYLFYPAARPQLQQETTNILSVSNAPSQTKEQEQTEEDYGVDCACEKTFEKPIDIVWTGKVFAYMMSGEAFGVERTLKNEEYPVFFACCIEGRWEDDKWIIDDIDGKVRVAGKWTGITCAYGNTIFGRCVPNVEIEKIEEIK